MIKRTLFSILFCSTLGAQSGIDLTVNFQSYVKYYVSSVDLNTGSSNVPIFQATLENYAYPADTVGIPIIVDFKVEVDSDVLGLNNEIFVWASTDPFLLRAPIFLSNQDLTMDTREIYDSEGNRVDFSVTIHEQIANDDIMDLLNIVVQTGRLPNGYYKMTLSVWNEDHSIVLDSKEEILVVTNPTQLQLVSPGGALPDTSQNEIYTSFPIFQWDSDPCMTPEGCDYYIRVAEFIPEVHASVEQAIESTTRLPLNQSEGYAHVGPGVTSYQYPVSGAGDLNPGGIYVWQVKKAINTTEGAEEILSEIFAFKIIDFTNQDAGGDEPQSETSSTNPTMMALRTLIGDTEYLQLFEPGGALEGFSSTDHITIDGVAVEISDIQSLFSQGVPVVDSLGTTTYHELEVLSMEVTE